MICYNFGQVGNLSRDFQNPTAASSKYFQEFGHEIEDCPILLAKMQENHMQQSTHNIQMMIFEPR